MSPTLRHGRHLVTVSICLHINSASNSARVKLKLFHNSKRDWFKLKHTHFAAVKSSIPQAIAQTCNDLDRGAIIKASSCVTGQLHLGSHADVTWWRNNIAQWRHRWTCRTEVAAESISKWQVRRWIDFDRCPIVKIPSWHTLERLFALRHFTIKWVPVVYVRQYRATARYRYNRKQTTKWKHCNKSSNYNRNVKYMLQQMRFIKQCLS